MGEVRIGSHQRNKNSKGQSPVQGEILELKLMGLE